MEKQEKLPDPRHALGRAGEKAAAAYLARNGMRIESGNYRCPLGEIDIIAREGERWVFVEVKTRREPVIISPLRAVNSRKQGRIVRAAQWYLKERGLDSRATPCRFDVVTLGCGGGGIEHLRGAFRPRRGRK